MPHDRSIQSVRLTKTARRAGCAAKQPPGYLFPLLARLPPAIDPRVLIGSATADDAAVVRLDPTRSLVFTTDFFTPIVDDAYDFGAIAAANALSDVYAMGGEPLCALNLVGFPSDQLEPEVLVEILRGGAEKSREAGIDVVGGHSIQSDEPIYGLAVTGLVETARVISNAAARPGDVLILTKPIGVGIVATAAKQDRDTRGGIGEAIALMKALNRSAAEAMRDAEVHAATDVTGFGLLGHLRNLVAASGCAAEVRAADVPCLPAARAYAEVGIAPGGTRANARFLEASVRFEPSVDAASRLLLCDAQTSGGLLIAAPPAGADGLIRALRDRGTPAAACVGTIERGEPGTIHVR